MNKLLSQPTMTLHEIAAKLWVTDRDAYYNLLIYIEQLDRNTDELRSAMLTIVGLNDQITSLKERLT